MAHELTIRANGRAEMAFVGETPWHGLGQSVTKGASIGVWAKEAGMDWKAEEAKVLYETSNPLAGGSEGDMREDLVEAEGYKMLYRSDDKKQLAIVGSGYEVVQPIDVLEFFRDMTEAGGWHIHTAGSLRGGRKLWAMASNGEFGKVGKGDEIARNLLLATSLDGSMKTIAMETAVRVVCANTLSLALNKAGASQVTVSHRTQFDADLVKRALGINVDSFKQFMLRAQEMADTPINMDDARSVLRVLFKVEGAKEKTKPKLAWLGDLSQVDVEPEAKDTRALTRILDLFNGEGMGAGLTSAKGTTWGLLNAITQHVDHEQGRTNDSRLDSAWFGRGNKIKQDAAELLAAF